MWQVLRSCLGLLGLLVTLLSLLRGPQTLPSLPCGGLRWPHSATPTSPG